MEKPLVFLSHSKKDVAFIEQIKSRLEACTIGTWFDEIDIPHGSPWMDTIFNIGIPECDVVFVYLTANSIGSKLVQRELDSALIEELRKRKVKVLPYVESEQLRDALRPDIVTLQVPVLNKGNLDLLLPRIVSEIWRYYTHKQIWMLSERHKLEIENRDYKYRELVAKSTADVFTDAENNEFENIFVRLQAKVRYEVSVSTRQKQQAVLVELRHYEFTECAVFLACRSSYGGEFNYSLIQRAISVSVAPEIQNEKEFRSTILEVETKNGPSIIDDLLKYGLLDRNFRPMQPADSESVGILRIVRGFHSYQILQLSAKCDRFVYWVEYKQKVVEGPALIDRVGAISGKSET